MKDRFLSILERVGVSAADYNYWLAHATDGEIRKAFSYAAKKAK